MKALCFALFACAFNLLLGFTGLLSFGHAAFFGSAGYVLGHSMKVWGWSPEAGLLIATAASGLGSLNDALVAVRNRILDAVWPLVGTDLVCLSPDRLRLMEVFPGIPCV